VPRQRQRLTLGRPQTLWPMAGPHLSDHRTQHTQPRYHAVILLLNVNPMCLCPPPLPLYYHTIHTAPTGEYQRHVQLNLMRESHTTGSSITGRAGMGGGTMEAPGMGDGLLHQPICQRIGEAMETPGDGYGSSPDGQDTHTSPGASIVPPIHWRIG
jgi:hypothetical protein